MGQFMNQPKTDKEWQAYYDAQTMVTATAIKNDPERSKAAKAQLSIMMDEQSKMMDAIKKTDKAIK